MAYVVYPSWKFLVSGGCRVEVDRLTIEAIRGELKPLLRGTRNPDVAFSYAGPFYEHHVETVGDASALPEADLNSIKSFCKRLSPHEFISLEWSITDARRLLFHDWYEE